MDITKAPAYIKNELLPKNLDLSLGRKGREVRRVQEWLDINRFNTSIDGDFGPATEFALKEFQIKKKLPPTGKVDRETWEKLCEPMSSALIAPIKKPSTIPSLVKFFSERHLRQHPKEVGGANRGPWVRLYCYGNDGPEWAWCAGFVTLILQQAYFYANKKAPIRGSVSCDTLAGQAKSAGLFIHGRDLIKGKVKLEDLSFPLIFLKRRTSSDWTHTGFALSATGKGKEIVFSTIEGNTNSIGVREGFEACSRTRSLINGDYDFLQVNT